MEHTYFHARKTGAQVETSGTPAVLLGHQLRHEQGAKPDGVFVEWAWDGTRLTVRNDRYGFYPLFFYCKNQEICISPSIARLVQEGASREFDYAGLAVFLRLGYFIGEDTPFKHIRALAPGTTLEWDGVMKVSSDGFEASKPCVAIPRDEAIDTYITLFAQSIERRPPTDDPFAIALSGGRDSRHILLELLRQGHVPTQCVTAPKYLSRTDPDVEVAGLLARELRLSHLILESKEFGFNDEWSKNVETSFCSDEHTWYMEVSHYLSENFRMTYDGIGGDVLSAGLFLSQDRLDQFESGDSIKIATNLLGNVGSKLLPQLLRPNVHTSCNREVALERLEREVTRHFGAPNPVGSFFFWNRTRREIALSPYGLLGSVPKVYAPYLDCDVVDFLTSLPASLLLDRQFHTDVIIRAYPEYKHIPFESKSGLRTVVGTRRADFGRSLVRRLLPRMHSALMRNGFLLPHFAAILVDAEYATESIWFTPLVLYLHQLETLSTRYTT